MSKHTLVENTVEAWEQRSLGCDAKFAEVAPPEVKASIDEMLGMQAISIRLHKELIENFKAIARIHGVGYQPLMRDALRRFADSEIKQILIKVADEKERQQKANQSMTESKGHIDPHLPKAA